MTSQLTNHFVAFIDLLGFSSMVNHDCENPETAHKYIDKLKETHKTTKELKKEIDGLQLTQFSDSIVLALPYNRDSFSRFIKLVADYQYNLLQSGILCRGGISYGMHFFEDDFLFSNGLIHAYHIEKEISINPRIVISKDLMELIYPQREDASPLILKESDGSHFVNYLFEKQHDETWAAIESIVPTNLPDSASVRGKQIWLLNYYNFMFPKEQQRSVNLFE